MRIGINGFGRIGRNFYRAAKQRDAELEIVAVNDLGSVELMAHLLAHDSVHGSLGSEVSVEGTAIHIGGEKLEVLAERDPAALPWGDMGVDVVVESTGIFTKRSTAAAHLDAGAKKVVISAPASDVDATFVVGVNDGDYDPDTHHVVSNASCTTNCFVPLVKVLGRRLRRAARVYDHRPRLHGRPVASGWPAFRHATCPCRCRQHRADIHWRSQGYGLGAAGYERSAGRRGFASACGRWLHHRFRSRAERRTQQRRHQCGFCCGCV